MQRVLLHKYLLNPTALLFAVTWGVSLMGCGLVDAPPAVPAPSATHKATGSPDFLNSYFEYVPNGSTTGTIVLYRIYADMDVLTSQRAAIQSANKADSQKGYDRAVGLGYQELDTSLHRSYLTQNSSDKIRIRLFDDGFTESSLWKAGVFSGGNANTETSADSVPLRRGLNNKGFSFFYTTDANGKKTNNPKPANGDIDYNSTGHSSSGPWYVNAYAVSVGQDAAFTIYHSTLADLGFIMISQ
jgi:hypothetical protein